MLAFQESLSQSDIVGSAFGREGTAFFSWTLSSLSSLVHFPCWPEKPEAYKAAVRGQHSFKGVSAPSAC